MEKNTNKTKQVLGKAQSDSHSPWYTLSNMCSGRNSYEMTWVDIFYLVLIGVELLYNVVLASPVQQSESDIWRDILFDGKDLRFN